LLRFDNWIHHFDMTRPQFSLFAVPCRRLMNEGVEEEASPEAVRGGTEQC
jgi:hypothetical protein